MSKKFRICRLGTFFWIVVFVCDDEYRTYLQSITTKHRNITSNIHTHIVFPEVPVVLLHKITHRRSEKERRNSMLCHVTMICAPDDPNTTCLW